MLTEHEMLVTLATMALRMNDLTGHDVVEALKAHGYGGVVEEVRGNEPAAQECECAKWTWLDRSKAIDGHHPECPKLCPNCHRFPCLYAT